MSWALDVGFGTRAASTAPACDLFVLWRTCTFVNPKRASDQQDESTLTLGDLLYADTSSTPISEDDWTQLVNKIGAGDQQALRALYERTHRIVFTLAIRICGSREIAEEVTVDVFHDVWRRAAEYDPTGGSAIGWIMMQARSRAIDRVRFEHRKKRVDPHPSQPEPTTSPADAIDAQQRRRLLEGAMTVLTDDERLAIETAFFSGLTYAETAARLDEPLGTVKTRVRSALAKLRRSFDGEGGGS